MVELVRQRSHPVYQMVALLEELGEAVAVTDRTGHLIHINLSAQRLLGVIGDDIAGANVAEWVEELAAATDIEFALSEFAMIPGSIGRENTVTLLQRNGATCKASLVACRSELDENPVFVCLMRDQSEVNRVREQMLDAQRLVRSILQNTSEGYVLIDASGMITDINPAFEEMCGRNAMDLLDSRFDRLFDGRDRKTMDALVSKLEKGRTASGEISFQAGEDGEARLGLFKGAPLFDARNERVGIFGLITDITEAKERERKIEQLAYFDPLTDLANRSLLRDKLEQATMFSQRSQRKFALLFLDLDRFKHVNDTYNHPLGDQVLQEVAQRIRQVVRRSDVVSRFGGDEFVIGLVEPKRIEDVALVAEKLLESVAQPLAIDDKMVHITTSIGISVFPDDANSVDELIRNADLAMYQAKEEGRARYSYFTETLNDRVRRQREMERQMRSALDQDEFMLYYQPKVDGRGKIVGAEALIRWQSPVMGFVSPGDFIPLAEETGLIVRIGEWVLREAARQIGRWKSQGLPQVPVAVNVSGKQLHHPDFRLALQKCLAESDDCGRWLDLEITESMLMKDVELTIALLHDLREMGFELSVDDFGTGYSSFSYLTRFPIQTLKIDQSFVRDLPGKRSAAAIVNAITGMARNLGLKTVAEGVETREQAEYLTALGCDQLQGYFFSRPVPAEQFAQLLQAETIQP